MGYDIKITPRSEREKLITDRLEQSTEDGDKIYEFRGDTYTPKVVSLDIATPVYRMENCRTFSAQQSEMSKDNLDRDFFDMGQELSTAQQAQHQILVKLSKEGASPIYDVLATDGQRESILITNTGVVVDGNRRLSAMRDLLRGKDGSIDSRYTHVRCAVLPPDTTLDEVDDIEADIQARPDTKLEYDWIGDARLIRRQVSKSDRTAKDVAKRLRRSKPDIENVLQALDEAELYLSEWIEKPGQYDLLSGDGRQIFGDIPKNIAKKDTALQNASRAIAWSLFENRDRVSGRVYNLNAAFGKLAPTVLDMLADQLELDDTETDEDSDYDGDFSIEIDADGDAPDYSKIIDALRHEETKDDAVTVLIDACETAIEMEKGRKSEKAALKALSQVNAKLTGIDVLTAGTITLPAMLKQIETIKAILEKIEAGVVKRQNGDADGNDAEGTEA
tara:strand:+ start:27230 stop:28570 length:1341 start_codon:yes stop_codon:yes gene_type:complete